MRKIAREGNGSVKYLLSEKVTVLTQGTTNLKSFLNQRTRWASKGSNYGSVSLLFQFALVMIYCFNVMVLLIPFWFWHKELIFISLLILPVKIGIDFVTMIRYTKLYHRKDLRSSFFAAELLQLIYVSLTPPLAFLRGYHWKGRLIKK